MRDTYAEKLMTMIANGHLWHFYTKSYAAHEAFGKFYEGLEGLADRYIEADIGVHGAIGPSHTPFYFKDIDCAVKCLREFKSITKVIRDGQEKAGQNGLVAILEEISAHVDQTLYRLENLS